MSQRLVDFNVTPEGLVISIVPEGDARQEIEEIAAKEQHPDVSLAEIAEYNLCNSDWELLSEMDHYGLGNLTEAPTFSCEVDRDDHGDILNAGTLYLYNDYQIRFCFEELLREGRVVFMRHVYDENWKPML